MGYKGFKLHLIFSNAQGYARTDVCQLVVEITMEREEKKEL